MTTADGSVIGTTQIFGSAPANHAFNVVLLAEGFTTAQQPAFDIACATFLTAFRAIPPYDELSPAINVFRSTSAQQTPAPMTRPQPEGPVRRRGPTSTPPLVPTGSVDCWSATTPRL